MGWTALMGRWPSILTALFTGLTALFAGFLWWETRTHDTLALKPSVDIYTGADPDTPPVGISITNSGPGPALIKSVTFFVDRKPVQDANEAGITYAKLSEAQLNWYELEPDDTLAVNETEWLIRYRKPRGGKNSQQSMEKFSDFIDQHLAVEVRFCSIRGSCSTKCSTKGRCG